MFSRLALRDIQNAGRCLITKYQPTSSTSSTPATPQKTEVPAQSGQRDLVNFPRRARAERSPKTRFGFIPDSWFHFFYPKTGVTGPYMFMATVGTYLLSKEIYIFEHNAANQLSLIFVCFVIHQKYGDKIREIHSNLVKKEFDEINSEQQNEIEGCKQSIQAMEESKNLKEVAAETMKAKREIILLQMEAAYRSRLAEAHKSVQKRLDCLVELENVERRITQKNLIDYVLRNVKNAITPDLEKIVMQNCITELNSLAAKA